VSALEPIAAADRAFRLPPAPERSRRRLPFSPWHLFLMPVAAVMLLPLVWMVVLSLETEPQAAQFPPVLFPSSFHISNYPAAWNSVPFGDFFLNSAAYSLATVAGNLLFCSLAAYAFARIRFFGRELLFVVFLATLMVPFQVLLM
jgi:multiple sugar transport system permease protein